MHRAAIALGSNLASSFGSPADNLRIAVERIGTLGRVHAVSSFEQDLICPVERIFHHLVRLRVGSDRVHCSGETQEHSLKSLPERVVQVSRDAVAFHQALAQLRL